jgi:VirE N-terminal domain
MTAPLAAAVSLFQGSTNTTPFETLPLMAVLQRIQEGAYRGYVEQLRRTLATQGEDAYDVDKKRSIAFTPAGTFRVRNSASLDTPSGCLNLDIDDLPDVNHARALLGADPHLVYMFTSPSGGGLKLGIHVKRYADAESYRHFWRAVERYLVETYPDLAVSNDRQCKDVARLCYMSWDPDLYCNPASVAFVAPPAAPARAKPTHRSLPTAVPPERQQRYADQAIATAIQILDASVARTPTSNGTRDRQRLKAARLLGGYIAGGVLTEAEAKAGITAAVERNTTKLTRAWRVIERGFRYGEAVPITLAHLEAEYQQWCALHTTRHPTPSPASPTAPEEPRAAIVHHQVPDHILRHPDPRVREHWTRIYRRTAILKERYAREGGLLCPK